MFIKNHRLQNGFTLIEIAVVLVIVGLLVGSFIGSISNRIETTRRDDTAKQLDEIKEAIIGHALATGRIPCPTTTTGAGQEQPVGGGNCTLQHGFVPGATLGLNGSYNLDGLLLDSWGNPIRYTVATANGNAFTTAPGGGGSIQEQAAVLPNGLDDISPALLVCPGVSAIPNSCEAGDNPITQTAPFILLSLGKDGSNFVTNVAPNTDQGENASEVAVVANAAGENIAYTVANDRAFVSKAYSDEESAAGQFDDIIIWMSEYILYSRMMEAGQLP